MKLLLIEDDEELGQATLEGLRLGGHSAEWVQDGEEGLFQALEWEWDLIVLDRMLPKLSGTEILAQIKKKKSTPVLMLTALNEIDHRLEGFDAGADDYLGKPFELRELLARIRALGRQVYHQSQSERVVIGELVVDCMRMLRYHCCYRGAGR